jgi:hypothetical protein
MAKKKNKTETMLKRAQKLFDSKNYLEAEKRFEKLSKKLHTAEIAEKLDICRQKNRVVKGEILLKKGHEAINANALQEAISFFKQAQELLDDPEIAEKGLAEKIRELEQKQEVSSIDEAAVKADKAGDYPKAAALYEDIWRKSGNQKFADKSGIRYVKAGCEDKALTVFRQTEPRDQAGFYYYGFALAKTGQYPEALIQWEKIDSKEKEFIKQKEWISELAFPVIYQVLQKELVLQKEPGLQKEPDIRKLRAQVSELKDIARKLGQKTLEKGYEPMLHYCSLILMEALWEQEDYYEVAELMEHLPFTDEPALIALQAKLYYHLSLNEKAYLQPMIKAWFTAILFANPELEFSDKEEQEGVYQKLNSAAEERIKKHFDTQASRRAAALFDIEKKLITDLKAISKADHSSPIRILTPYYAAASGNSQIFLDIIKQNKAYFKDQEHYLETGGYYTRVWESLYELRGGEPDKAQALILKSTDKKLPTDEFIDYVVAIVQFECGQFCLERGEKKYLRYFTFAHKLFESAPSIEKRFADRFVNYYGKHMAEYERVLKLIYEKRPSDPISKAYSTIMAEMSIKRYNDEKINDKQLAPILNKALEIDPDNDLAQQTLVATLIDIERFEITKAMCKNKMQKAASMVLESEYLEIEEHFFSDAEEIFDMICQTSSDKEISILALTNLFNACKMVDASHILVDEIDEKLKEL